MKHHLIKLILITIISVSYASKKVISTTAGLKSNTTTPTKAKFEPEDGKCLFFIGQDLEATGGFNNYNNGYCDHFSVPAGFTVYTNLSPNSQSYGFINKGNDGLTTKANWGAGDSCAQCYLDNPKYQHSMLAIGLSMVNNEKNIAKGKQDDLIIALGTWIKNTKRPVFLRIGYEFDGWDWNHYNKKHYLNAWRRINKLFKQLEVNNVALVWQSKGNGSSQAVLEDWYPGDDLVDWCGYSYFGNPDQEMLIFARKHNKPVFIAEATPVMQQDNLFFNTDLKDTNVAKVVWEEWFKPFIKTLNNYKDVIKAFSYINSDWSSQPMWITNPTFQKVDSRIQESPFISKKWEAEISKPRYLKPSPELWDILNNN